MSLLDKLRSVGSIKAETVATSSFFAPKDLIQTNIPIINVAFSGTLDGGLVPGLTILAGPSKHFKSNLGLVCVSSYMKKYKDSVCLFYDSEFGITPEYMLAHGIDTERVLHIPLEHIEQLKFDIMKRLSEIKKGDKVIIFIDSIGNLASKKEVDDAENEKSVADMTRAKSLKSLFRIITPHLTLKDLPCIAVNHVYEETGIFARTIVSGGSGLYYSANQIFIIGRSQEKVGTDVVGYNFTINIEKSRFVKEKSKLHFQVLFNGGIDKFSGLLDLALESGYVQKPSNGWYIRVDKTTGEILDEKKVREADTHNKAFWAPILSNPDFYKFVKDKFQLSIAPMNMDDTDD